MSSIVIQGDTSGSITVEAPSVAGTHTLTLPKATGNIATDATVGLGMKNLIINGDMKIDQRNAGASVTPTNGSFVTDRFRQLLSVASKYTGQQSTDAPSGFTNSLLLTSSSAYTVGSAEVFGVEQRIEGYNITNLAWGTANAKTVTLSFWVKSSLTGTLSGVVSNNTNASYPFDYTILSANTWEKKTITISGPTIGTWLSTNGVGITVKYMIGIDPTGTWANTPNVWTGTNEFGATSQNVDIVGTSGATWQLTGVQLEVGENATPFEYRMYGTELALCQRYYYNSIYAGGDAYVGGFGICTTSNANNIRCSALYPVTMRTSPSITFGSSDIDGIGGFGSPTAVDIGTQGIRTISVNNGTTGRAASFAFKASAEL